MISGTMMGMRLGLALLLGGTLLGSAAQAQYGAPAFREAPGAALTRHLRTIADQPRNVAALTGAARAALELGDPQAALTFFARAEEIAPGDGRIKAGMAAAFTQTEQVHAALKFFGDAASLGVPDAELAGDRGLVHDLLGSPARAQADYNLSLRRLEDPEVRRRLALSLAISGKREEALAAIAGQLRAQDRAAWRTRTFILALTGNADEATNAAKLVMPMQAAQMRPFFAALPALSPAERAMAVHFGHFPSDGRMRPVVAATQIASAAPATSSNLPRRKQSAAAPVSSEPRRRPGAEVRPRSDGRRPLPSLAERYGYFERAPRPTRPAPATGTKPTVVADAQVAAAQPPRQQLRLPSVSNPSPARIDSAAPAPKASVRATNPEPKPAQIAAAQTPLARPVTTPPPASQATDQRTISAQSAPASSGAPLVTPAFDLRTAGAAITPPAPAAPSAPVPSPGFDLRSAGPVVTQNVPSAVPTAVNPGVGVQTAGVLPGVSQSAPASSMAQSVPGPDLRAAGSAPAITQAAPSGIQLADIAPSQVAVGAPTQAQAVPADASPAAPAPAPAPAPAAVGPQPGTRPTALASLADAIASLDDTAAAKPAVPKPAYGPKVEKPAPAKSVTKAEPKKAEPAAVKEQSRHWVQIAGGADEAAMNREFVRLKAKAPKLLSARTAWTTPLRATNRLLVGPFKSNAEAQDFVNELAKLDLPAFSWTSPAGQEIVKLAGK